MNSSSSRRNNPYTVNNRLTDPFKSARQGASSTGSGMLSGFNLVLLLVAIVVLAVVIYLIVKSTQVSKKQKERDSAREGFHAGSYQLTYLHMDGCSYCRKFDPTWKQLRKEHEVEFQKMDVGLKDHESKTAEAAELSPNGYPTIVLVKSGETVATFKGERTVPALVKFVKDNAE